MWLFHFPPHHETQNSVSHYIHSLTQFSVVFFLRHRFPCPRHFSCGWPIIMRQIFVSLFFSLRHIFLCPYFLRHRFLCPRHFSCGRPIIMRHNFVCPFFSVCDTLSCVHIFWDTDFHVPIISAVDALFCVPPFFHSFMLFFQQSISLQHRHTTQKKAQQLY